MVSIRARIAILAAASFFSFLIPVAASVQAKAIPQHGVQPRAASLMTGAHNMTATNKHRFASVAKHLSSKKAASHHFANAKGNSKGKS
jgi:hypothetical protein